MAQGKFDLPPDLAASKPSDSLVAKDSVDPRVGNDEQKGLTLNADFKEQVTLDNNIPLSPQWLHAKPNEIKGTLSAASNEKKDWRRNMPEIEGGRRWREEERETGLLGRKERKKESDRENDQRKNERRPDSVSIRETDPRISLSTDRRQEPAARVLGHENRRDNKWSSRWGSDDRERESRVEKKAEVEKDDAPGEKMSSIGSNRLEGDSRDKWRPRHRQELLAGGSSSYRAAPGFGLERGRAEGTKGGFAPGRGRANVTGSSIGGPICAPYALVEPLNGMSSATVPIFRYPRGKLLDIYRKSEKSLPSDSGMLNVEDTTIVTQRNPVQPFAFVMPDVEEESILGDIWRGKVISSDLYFNPSADRTTAVDGNDKYLDHGSSNEHGYDELSGVSLDGIFHSFLSGMDPLSDEGIEGEKTHVVFGSNSIPTSEVASDVLHYSSRVTAGSNHFEGGKSSSPDRDYNKNAFLGIMKLDNIGIHSSDDYSTLPNEWACFDFQKSDGLGAPTEELSLFYQDPQGEIQGPFLGVDIISWFEQGFFGTELPVCLSDDLEDMSFKPLGELMPHLKCKPQLVSSSADDKRTKILNSTEGVRLEPEIIGQVSLTDQHRTLIASDNHAVQGVSAVGNNMIDRNLGRSSNILDERQHLLDDTEHDTEEVFYSGRPSSRTSNSNNIQFQRNNDLHPLGLSWAELEAALSKQPLSSNVPIFNVRENLTNNGVSVTGSSMSHWGQELSQISLEERARNAQLELELNQFGISGRARMLQLEGDSNQFSLEEQMACQFQKQQLVDQQNSISLHHQNVQPLVEHGLSSLSHQFLQNQPVPDMDILKLQIQRHQHLQQLQQQQQMHQQQQLHHRQLLLQQHRQQRLQEEQQLLLEQLVNQRLHKQGFGADALREQSVIEQLLLKQRLLQEAQHQPHLAHLGHDLSADQLIQLSLRNHIHHPHVEELLYSLSKHRENISLEQLQALQQDQLHGQQFPNALLQRMDGERHLGGIWPNDDGSGQPNVVQHCLPSAFEQPCLEHNLMLHGGSFQGVHEPNLVTLERSMAFSDNVLGRNVDLASLIARHEGLDRHDQHGQMLSFEQMSHFTSSAHSRANQASNNYSGSRADKDNQHFDPNLPLQHKLMDSQFNQSHLHIRQEEARLNHPIDSLHSWASLSKGDENRRLVDLVQQNIPLHSPQTLGMRSISHGSSYNTSESHWPFSRVPTGQQFNVLKDKVGMGNSFAGNLHADAVGQAQHQRFSSVDIEEQSNNVDNYRRHILYGSQLDGTQHHLPEWGTVENATWAGSSHTCSDDVDPTSSSLNESKIKMVSKSFGKKVSLESAVELGSESAFNHGEMISSAPTRHSSLGGVGTPNLSNYGAEVANAYGEKVLNDRVPEMFQKVSGKSSFKAAQSPASDLSSLLPNQDRSTMTLLSFQEDRQELGRNPSPQEDLSACKRDGRFIRRASCSDTENSDMLKSTKKPASSVDNDASTATMTIDPSDCGQGGKLGKKKGKKGKQIDPSLLGFKVHSNRIMMGEIQRPDD